MELYQILILVFALILVGLYIYKRITGVSLLQHIALTQPVVTAVAAAIEAAYKLWPNDVLKIAYTALRAGAEAAEMAEKLYKMGELPKDERNAYAKNMAKETLTDIGVEITPQIEMIVAGIIEVMCILLPHEEKEEEKEPEEVA